MKPRLALLIFNNHFPRVGAHLAASESNERKPSEVLLAPRPAG
jgi:hypothetical protein